MRKRLSPIGGFTLVELMITVAVAAILLVVVVPSFVEQLARRQLEGAATELNGDLQYTRARAVARSAPVSLSTNAGGTQYTVSSGANTYKTVTLPGPVTISPNVTITYDQLRAMASAPGDIAMASSRTGAALTVKISPMGRVSMCSPSGSFAGYTSC